LTLLDLTGNHSDHTLLRGHFFHWWRKDLLIHIHPESWLLDHFMGTFCFRIVFYGVLFLRYHIAKWLCILESAGWQNSTWSLTSDHILLQIILKVIVTGSKIHLWEPIQLWPFQWAHVDTAGHFILVAHQVHANSLEGWISTTIIGLFKFRIVISDRHDAIRIRLKGRITLVSSVYWLAFLSKETGTRSAKETKCRLLSFLHRLLQGVLSIRLIWLRLSQVFTSCNSPGATCEIITAKSSPYLRVNIWSLLGWPIWDSFDLNTRPVRRLSPVGRTSSTVGIRRWLVHF
jgi:hypothetical protein